MIAWLKEERLAKVPRLAQWFILLVLSVVLMVLLEWCRLPAALLLGPMFAGILIETAGGKIRVPEWPRWFSQAVIGCLVARSITPEILRRFAAQWPLLLGIMLAVIAASSALGWLLSRFRVLPDTTAVWGLLPGLASIMMLVAEGFGADGRLVAFMQYLRVVLVALAGAIVARFCLHVSGHAASTIWFSQVHWAAFFETLIFLVVCVFIGMKSGNPAVGILVPLILGSILHLKGILTIELPPWLLVASYAVLGWNTGLRFTRPILVHAARALPQIFVAVILLMAFCGGLAWVLVRATHIDPLTAYLATSPGGVDSAVIIAASTKVDMPFVMSMQVARLLIVLMIGPALSRWVARLIQRQMRS